MTNEGRRVLRTGDVTAASTYIGQELEKLLPMGGPWRVGALFLSYDDSAAPEVESCRVGTGVLIRVDDVERGAAHLLGMIKTLRDTAETLQQRLERLTQEKRRG